MMSNSISCYWNNIILKGFWWPGERRGEGRRGSYTCNMLDNRYTG
jgi:hypothetical protein